MRLQQKNNWNNLARLLAMDRDEGHDHQDFELSDEDKRLLNVFEKIRLDCDYDYAFQIKEEVLEKTYHKIFDDNGAFRKKTNSTLFTVLFAIAASIAVLLSISNVYFYKASHEKEKISQVVFSSSNSVSNIVLPDSTLVTLNAGSILSYETTYNKSERRVHLTGEAYFVVRPDKERAFVVLTDKVEVKALGTVFNVSAYPEENEVVTSLISGVVQLGNSENEAICQLRPNQAAVYNKESSHVEIGLFEPEYVTSWITDKLLFKKKSFPYICKVLEKKFNCTIRIDNKEVHKKVFTGKFMSGETLPEIFKVIQINVPFKYKIEDSHITIY